MRHRFFAALVSTRRRATLVVVLWIVLVGAMGSLAPSLTSVEDNSSANEPAAGSSSLEAQRLIDASFGDLRALPAVVAVRGAGGDPKATVTAVRAVTTALPQTGGHGPVISPACSADAGLRPGIDCIPGRDGMISNDGATQVLVVPMTGDSTSKTFRDDVQNLREAARRAAPDAQVKVTGPAGIIADATKAFASGDRVLLLGTVLLVLVILLLVYRAPLLALVPLLAVAIAMRLAESVGAILADAGLIVVSSQTASIMTVLLFGVGTDYALIITARYREALLHEPDRYRAMVSAMRAVTGVVVSSAATIALAMFTLLLCVSPSLRGFGPYLVVGVVSMAVVSFTFIPALTLLFGRAVFWPSGEASAADRALGGRTWKRIADLVIARPGRVLAGSLAALVVLCAGLIGYHESFDFVSGFRVATDSAAGQRMVADGLGAGEIAPTTVVVSADHLTDDQLQRIARSVATNLPTDVARASYDARSGLSDSGTVGRFTVALAANPYSPEAMDALPALRDSTQQAATRAGASGIAVHIAGETAKTADLRSALDRDVLVLLIAITLVVGLVLAALLRSVLAPIYLMITLLVSFAATMGALMAITVHLQADAGIGNRVSAYVLVFLIALGVDYTIFIMSRYREELRSTDPMQALHTAITRTGGVVSSAGLILAGTFAVLMTQPIRELYQFGLAMAIGILLDTFVVRPMLVPALVRLLADHALWPSRPRS